MTKTERIKELFKEFGTGSWAEDGKRVNCDSFICSCQESCKVNDQNPKYTAWLGDEDADVMLVAEAPSASNGVGCFFSGKLELYFNDYKNSQGFEDLIQFIRTQHDFKVPYFTDVVKCGASKQNAKGELSKRITNCSNKFLSREIEIINPKIIYCIGKAAASQIKILRVKGKVNKNTKIIELIHYSNQANLSLSKADKVIIWKIQSRQIKEYDFESIVMKLDLIKKLRNYLEV